MDVGLMAYQLQKNMVTSEKEVFLPYPENTPMLIMVTTYKWTPDVGKAPHRCMQVEGVAMVFVAQVVSCQRLP